MSKSPTVRSIDESAAKKALKDCPEIVRDYVAALERVSDGWHRLFIDLKKKLEKQPPA